MKCQHLHNTDVSLLKLLKQNLLITTPVETLHCLLPFILNYILVFYNSS